MKWAHVRLGIGKILESMALSSTFKGLSHGKRPCYRVYFEFHVDQKPCAALKSCAAVDVDFSVGLRHVS